VPAFALPALTTSAHLGLAAADADGKRPVRRKSDFA
jgi:hypothetical protein